MLKIQRSVHQEIITNIWSIFKYGNSPVILKLYKRLEEEEILMMKITRRKTEEHRSSRMQITCFVIGKQISI